MTFGAQARHEPHCQISPPHPHTISAVVESCVMRSRGELEASKRVRQLSAIVKTKSSTHTDGGFICQCYMTTTYVCFVRMSWAVLCICLRDTVAALHSRALHGQTAPLLCGFAAQRARWADHGAWCRPDSGLERTRTAKAVRYSAAECARISVRAVMDPRSNMSKRTKAVSVRQAEDVS